MSSSSSSSSSMSMVVVFGKPGAGKTTISNAAVKTLEEKGRRLVSSHQSNANTTNTRSSENANANNNEEKQQPICLLLDLDVCIPEWMKDNFAKGIYPTLDQRTEFARSACDHVDDEIRKATSNCNSDNSSNSSPLFIMISFSFVNKDLRDNFRLRFPSAKWALVDVCNATAQERIEQREGHFYKGTPKKEDDDNGEKGGGILGYETEKDSSPKTADGDVDFNVDLTKDEKADENNEWEFSPVDFDHIVLDGLSSIEENVNRLIDILEVQTTR